MNIGKRLVAAMALLGIVAPAAAAWNSGLGLARVNSVDGAASLDFLCDVYSPNREPVMWIKTGEDYDDTASYPLLVPILITVNGVRIALAGAFSRNSEGKLEVTVYHSQRGYDAETMLATFHALRDASGPISVAFYRSRLTFPSENARDAMNEVLRHC